MIRMVEMAYVLTCGHATYAKDWDQTSRVRDYCAQHGLQDVAAREVIE